MLFKFWLSLGISLFCFSLEPSGFILFFQPLYELSEETSQSYLKEFREILENTPTTETDELLTREYQNDICSKKKLRTCVNGLYSPQICISTKKKEVAKYCNQRSKGSTKDYFQESVFHRLQWNQFALQLSYSCQKTQSKLCAELNKLHMKYYLKFKQHRSEKLKERKLKKEWDH